MREKLNLLSRVLSILNHHQQGKLMDWQKVDCRKRLSTVKTHKWDAQKDLRIREDSGLTVK